ncbi:hypothetical protein [Mesonia maritima]|uniref:Glucan phosphoethanolaminetransferase (Alkaline phosphatase superfamily) n=1 Tax=Mesonia maritima TaxID=1793873 RepID=A0ABU1K7N3_9FLAO|nr:hypothetical protein [Mesonia maritima]MDR6301032.1 glucan phosphoethanolaminetransferase (alkaline phosphatase superfamily) [Mesonia maritima]
MGSIIAVIIAATPYIFYTYRSFPDTKVWETFLFTYESNWYQKISVSVWTIMTKFIPLLLMVIWFLTCKHWWYHVILIPTGMFFFQLISVINDDLEYTDEVEIWYLIPIMAIIIPLVYLIRAKLFSRMHGNNLDDFEEELKSKKSLTSQLKDLFK